MAATLTRPVSQRAVHLQITPRPSNLSESREIMRLMSQFGEIEYFKNLKYDALASPNKALVIYKEETAARECVRRSPLRFRMGQAQTKQTAVKKTSSASSGTEAGQTDRTALNLRRSFPTIPIPPPRPIRMPFDPIPAADPVAEINDDGRIFQVLSSHSFRNFRDIVNAGHYHGGFAIDSKMPGQPDLAKKVPLPGLSCVDWKARDKPWRIIALEKDKWGSKGSLGQMTGLLPASDDVRASQTPEARADPSGAVDFRPLSAIEEVDKTEEQRPQSPTDALSSIVREWGGTTGVSERDRYSGRRRRKWD